MAEALPVPVISTEGVNTSALAGRVISIESVGMKSHYFTVNDEEEDKSKGSKSEVKSDPQQLYLHPSGIEYTALPNAVETRFLVHQGTGNSLILESVKCRNMYLTCDGGLNDFGFAIRELSPPVSDEDYQWEFVSIGNGVFALQLKGMPGRCAIYYPNNRNVRLAKIDPDNPIAQWRVTIGPGGPINDGYEQVASLKNDSSEEAEFNYTYHTGMSKTSSSTTSITAKMSMEVSINIKLGPIDFGGVKMNIGFSKEWQQSQSETWEISEEISAKAKVKPGKTLKIYQLRANYCGQLRINSFNLQLKDE